MEYCALGSVGERFRQHHTFTQAQLLTITVHVAKVFIYLFFRFSHFGFWGCSVPFIRRKPHIIIHLFSRPPTDKESFTCTNTTNPQTTHTQPTRNLHTQGIFHMHQHGLAHLDIKPDNIFIHQSGLYKIGDFGLVSLIKCPNPVVIEEGDSVFLPREILQEDYSSLDKVRIYLVLVTFLVYFFVTVFFD